MKIKRYKLKPNITKEQLEKYGYKDGGSWVFKGCKHFISKYFHINYLYKYAKNKTRKCSFNFSVDIGFTDDINNWNDCDNVIVLDEDFLQPYTPFYANFENDVTNFPCLEKTVETYNDYMDSLDFLEEVIYEKE